jgi:atypical dual specificity phosphatase
MSNWFRVYGFADIQDKLLIGAYPLDEDDVAMLEWMKIERILNLVEDKEYGLGEREKVAAALRDTGIEEQRMSLTDYGRLPAEKLEHAVAEVIDWLEEGRRVYLHCRAGWQRSAAVAAGVVAITEGVAIEDALELVHRRKPSADPLPEQRQDLLRWWAERESGACEESGEGGERPASEEREERGGSDDIDTLLGWLAELDPARRGERPGGGRPAPDGPEPSGQAQDDEPRPSRPGEGAGP